MILVQKGPAPPMIRVFTTKDAKAPDGTLMTGAALEQKRAIEFFTNTDNFANEAKITKKSFVFKIYRDPELGAELERIFGKKCAYCESVFAHVTPKDVEHFRPKSKINTGTGDLVPGYFWLAGDWDNLLVACPDCNRGRKFDVPGQPKRMRLGKSTQFPLASEKARVRRPKSLAKEDALRLIIDPTREEPSEHLTFDSQGLILARPDPAGQPSPKGLASITVYALQRKVLVEERRRVLDLFVSQVVQLQTAIQNLNDFMAAGSAAGIERNREAIRGLKVTIKGMLGKDAPYIGMLRDWIRRQKAAGAFPDLAKAKVDLEDFIAT
jgi:uncharacterized protein (TIGR02646 family)